MCITVAILNRTVSIRSSVCSIKSESMIIEHSPDEELHEVSARPAVVASHLVQACNLVILVHRSHVPATKGKGIVPGGRTFMQNCVKKARAYLPGVVNYKLSCGQMCKPVHHMPLHSRSSPRVVVVAQEVDGLAVLPGNGTQTSLAPEFIPAMFGQSLAQFLWVVLAAWHDSAATRSPSSFFSRWKSAMEL